MMKKLEKITVYICLCLLSAQVFGQAEINPDNIREKMQWFADAKLGIFIHAGIYSVEGVTESWSFHLKQMSYDDYVKQLDGFTLKNYDPEAWADLIRETGARYSVITTKHHDGVAMYDTKMNDLSIVKATPAKRDMTAPFFEALRKRGIKCGAYFSLLDWSHSDYPGFLQDSSRYKVEDDYDRWYRYRAFMQGQINEILHLFNPDLWWFDGDWEHSAERWESEKIRHKILSHNPDAIINGRLRGYGDYVTPEQNFPVNRPAYDWWELCLTINDNWGYRVNDTNWKRPYEIINIFVDVVSKGGNLLLDFGPREDGTIQKEKVHVLRELGKWNNKHEEAVFSTIAGMPHGHFYGPSTLSKDSTVIYLFLAGNPQDQQVIRGLSSEIEKITIVGFDQPLNWKIVGKIPWIPIPGLVFIDAPAKRHQDKYMTVLKVELKEPLRLYRGEGRSHL